MSASEKNAWFLLGVVAFTVASYVVSTLVWGMGIASTCSLFLMGLAGLLPFFQMKKVRRVACDERDTEIANKAVMASFVSLFIMLGLFPGWLTRGRGWGSVISMHIWGLYQVQMCIIIVAITVYSVATLVLYRRAG